MQNLNNEMIDRKTDTKQNKILQILQLNTESNASYVTENVTLKDSKK